jgi:hypothetical protein
VNLKSRVIRLEAVLEAPLWVLIVGILLVTIAVLAPPLIGGI